MMMLSLALVTTGAFAAPELTVQTMEVKNFKSVLKGIDVVGAGSGGIVPPIPPLPTIPTFPTDGAPPKFSFDQIGMVITIAKDIVALGESIYTLVQHGKPSNTTDFAPISVVPRDPLTKEIADPFDLEECSFPVEKKFVTTMKSGNMEVVRFEYMVIYNYNCSYNGTGKFIQNAAIIPVTVKTGYGWDFNATMKLSGIMNHGTKASPVVGAMLTVKYSMNSWRTAFERNDTFHITGLGELKSFSK